MALFGSSSRGRIVAAGVVVVLVVVALIAVLRGGGDGLRGLRSHEVIAAAERSPSDSVSIDLRRGAERGAVLEALDDLPKEARFVNLKLGRVDLDLDRATGDTRAALVGLLLGAAAVRAPADSIEISRRLGIDVRVSDRSQAAPLVLELAERVPREGARGVGSGVRVQVVGSSPPGRPVLSLQLQSGTATETALGVVRAAQALGDREPRVSGGDAETELRVQASSLDDAADAWEQATRALARSGAADDMVELAVDRRRAGDGPTSPIVSGPASDDADRALALARRLEPTDPKVFATTDLSFARVGADDAVEARTAARAAEDAGVRRFQVAWDSASSDTAWMANTAGLSQMQTSVDDDPGVVLRVLAGASRARAAGIRALHWDRQAVDRVPRLRLARPTWLPVSAPSDETAVGLRRFARAVRAISWPGVARFDVIAGPGSCGGNRASAVVGITSTSSGSARRVEAGSSCTDEAALELVRRAWASTP